MKKLKSDDTLQDRLSELPDSLILHILSFLNTRYAVRTTILSKRWQHLWTTIPYLDFTELGKNPVETRNFINRALMLWEGTKILRFKLDLGDHQLCKTLHGDIDLWVRFVTMRNVEELCLRFREYHCEPYSPPQYLYSCSSITKLSLFGCLLRIHGVVHWDQLKSLTINVFSVTEAINQVLSGVPQLEIFDLSIYGQWEIGVNLSIRSSSLKRLFICNRHGQYDLSKHAVLTIWAPDLEELVISGVPYSKCLMMDVSSLRDVNLDFENMLCDAAIGETMRQIFPTFKHVKVVTLSCWCFKELVVMKGKYWFAPLPNVKLLRLDISNQAITPNKIVGLLEIFPELSRLHIESWCPTYTAETLNSEVNTIKSLLMQLRIVEIGWVKYNKSIFEFIEFFLNHATVLEKIVIRYRGNCRNVRAGDMILAAEKLLSLQRSFPNVELNFC